MADTNSTHPLVSVIVPVLHGDYLTQALDSIVGQTYTNWELVLVDDGANEQTKAIINSYATKESRFVHLKIRPHYLVDFSFSSSSE
jgi:glycosyltransferase involved in cell wall biosynthesis